MARKIPPKPPTPPEPPKAPPIRYIEEGLIDFKDTSFLFTLFIVCFFSMIFILIIAIENMRYHG